MPMSMSDRIQVLLSARGAGNSVNAYLTGERNICPDEARRIRDRVTAGLKTRAKMEEAAEAFGVNVHYFVLEHPEDIEAMANNRPVTINP